MIKIVRIALFCLLLSPAVTSTVHGQGVPVQVTSPVYQGFKLPTVNGTLHFSLSASENITLGYNGDNQTTYATAFSGNVAFITPSVLYPTTVAYSGGYLLASGGQNSSYFQSLSATQAFNRRNYSVTLSDSLSYLPQSPASGLTGVPGQGDLGGTPGTTQSVLTTSGDRINNSATGSFDEKLTGKTSLSLSGGYIIQRFLGTSDGLQGDGYSASGGISHRIDPRTSVSGSYHYNESTYAGEPGSFESQGATLSYNRQLTRQISAGLSGGPERIGGSSVTGVGPEYTYNANAHLSYTSTGESGTTTTVGYVRASNAGSGVTAGAETDSVFAAVSRRLAQSLQGSLNVSYAQNTSLQLVSDDKFESKSVVGSGQLNRAITRTLSVYASYTAQHQIAQGVAQGIAPLQGLVQTVAFGVTYSPSEVRLGRQ